jgi:hypothetical protein
VDGGLFGIVKAVRLTLEYLNVKGTGRGHGLEGFIETVASVSPIPVGEHEDINGG